MKKLDVIYAKVVIEAEEEDFPDVYNWVPKAIKRSFNTSDRGMVSVSAYNDDGERIGLPSTFGEPSDEARALMSEPLFDDDDRPNRTGAA